MPIAARCRCLSNRPPCLLLCPPAGEGDAEDAWLQRRENVNTDHRTVHGWPSACAVETAGHHHDRQVQTALGWTRWEGKNRTPLRPHTHRHTEQQTQAMPPKHWRIFSFAYVYLSLTCTPPYVYTLSQPVSPSNASLAALCLCGLDPDWFCRLRRLETLNILTSVMFSNTSHYMFS